MISADTAQHFSTNTFAAEIAKVRRAACGEDPNIFADIYQEENNIVIWQRKLSTTLQEAVKAFLIANSGFQTSMTVSPATALTSVSQSLGRFEQTELSENIVELVDMFCCLFDLKRAGLRLTALDSAMCPKFHVDKVPCRLVTTYQGVATEWLPHESVDRSKLGARAGLLHNLKGVKQLSCGDVGLLKGESWEGNENAGLVHRSPSVPAGENRLLLTLDFSH